MYLHLGQSVVIPDRDILGIFDLDNASWAYKTRELLERAEAEGRAMAAGEDIRHTIISNLDDPDNPRNQRIAVKGVIFDDLTLADWEAAKLGTIEAPFSAESYEILDY